MWKFVFSAVLLAIVLDSAISKKLPSFLKICKRNDPNLEKCLLENVEILKPRLKTGVPELYIPSLDPLIISEATLESGNNFKAKFTDIQLYHADNFILNGFDLNLDKYHVDIKITFPRLRIKSIYNINGQILVLNLDGKGPADGNYNIATGRRVVKSDAQFYYVLGLVTANVVGALSLKGEPYKKNNKEFVRWTKEKIDINIEKIDIFFDRIFGDNKELNDQTNRVINQNIDTIVEDLKPVIQQVVSEFIFSLVNRLFERFAISELFPSS